MTRESFVRPMALVILVLGLVAGNVHALPFSGLVVFGDSLADSGNNAWVFDNQVAPDLPPGSLRTGTPIAWPTRLWTPRGDRRRDPAGGPPFAPIGRQQIRVARRAQAGPEDLRAWNPLGFELAGDRRPAIEKPAIGPRRL